MFSRNRLVCLAFLIVFLSGCATTAPLMQVEKEQVYSAYKNDPFVPINVNINAGQFVTAERADALHYLGDQIEESGAFARVANGVDRWPFTLDLDYDTKPLEGDEAKNFANIMVGASTLFLVPTKYQLNHRLKVEVFHGARPVKILKYEELIDERMSIVDMADLTKGSRAGIDRLLAKMIKDLSEQNLLPRVSDIQKTASPPTRDTNI